MIELTRLNGAKFTLNSDLIETVENIPETKVTLTDDRHFFVTESREDITRKVVAYRRRILKNVIAVAAAPAKT